MRSSASGDASTAGSVPVKAPEADHSLFSCIWNHADTCFCHRGKQLWHLAASYIVECSWNSSCKKVTSRPLAWWTKWQSCCCSCHMLKCSTKITGRQCSQLQPWRHPLQSWPEVKADIYGTHQGDSQAVWGSSKMNFSLLYWLFLTKTQ